MPCMRWVFRLVDHSEKVPELLVRYESANLYSLLIIGYLNLVMYYCSCCTTASFKTNADCHTFTEDDDGRVPA
jgi:hypothetical protein